MTNQIPAALTFDDILMVPQYSEVLPKMADLTTRFSRNIVLKNPLVSAAMDTVTEEKMAITMALHGGIGVIHKNCDPDEQARMVRLVKRFENGFILEPVVLSPDNKIAEIIEIRQEKHYKSIPITEDGTLDTKVIGMVSRYDYLEKHRDMTCAERMTKIEDLLVTKGEVTLSEANDILEESKHSKLLILNDDDTLRALLTRKDIERNEEFPLATKDKRKRLRVAAAIGPAHNMEERVEKLAKEGVDVIIVDTAHGHSKGVIDCVKYVKKNYPKIDVVAGNIASAEAAKALIEAGADGIKVGIGPGSICTTRVVTGIGVPQFSAIMECAKVANPAKIPLIADGGIRYSGDAAKALAAGADCIMIGSLLAGTAEAPGEMIYSGGKTFKYYRGMGSIAAMKKGGKERYAQSNVADDKLVPEGIEGKILFKGTAKTELFQLAGGIRSAMGYNGAANFAELRKRVRFVQITAASLKESHPHDVSILKEAPNYRG